MSEFRLAEKPALDALEAMGWAILPPAEALAMRGEENRVLLKPVLIAALRDLNGISEEDAEAIYHDLSNLADNEDWQRKLRGGYSRRLTGENRDRPITLIDFRHPERNSFHAVRQLRVAAQRPRIPDIVLFVNGIPLVVIEAKSPLKGTATGDEAYEQIRQYERDIPRLFAPNAFNVLTDGMRVEYGALGAKAQYYSPWPDAWPCRREDFADDLSRGLWCLCEPFRLLDILAHFIVFELDPETGTKIKKVCRYQQLRAVNKAVERVAAGEHRKGLVWHTQGSGKSLTMVFLALKLKTHLTLEAETLTNPNILALTDRVDLDNQISSTFVACGLPNPVQCGKVEELRDAVNRGGNGQILLSTIFKFAGSKAPIPNSANWIVLVDECHRTQEKDLGAYLQATLPDAHFYGFTGTPIKSTDKDTYARFSVPGEGYLDKYGIDDAVRDGATVPILYEGRKADWAVSEAEIDILFDRWFVDVPDDKREELKRKGLTLATIAKHPERIGLIALDIWEHFKAVCQPDGFKAQVVAVDREAVTLYRTALSSVIAADLMRGGMEEEAATQKADGMLACVYSRSQEDNKPSDDPEVQALRTELEAHYLDAEKEKAAKLAFKKKGQDPQILIVCDKLLTGFDAPIEHVMYLDKPLKEHNLLQAIARTNRTCSLKTDDGGVVVKPNGRIVDYIGVTKHLDEALRSYRADDVENAMRDIAVLRNDLKEAHARYRAQKRAMGLDGMDEQPAAFRAAELASEGQEDDWFDLQRLTRIFIKIYADLSPDPAILDFTAEVKWAATFLRLATQAIAKDESLDHRSYSGKIRDMLEQHVHVTGLSTTIRLRDITDPKFGEDFDTDGKNETEQREAFVRKSAELRRVTRELVDKNPAQFGRFSERVMEIIARFESGQISSAEGLAEYQGLADDISTEQGAHADAGISKNAFSIQRILEDIVPATPAETLQDAAVAIDALYAEAAETQPAFAHMDAYLRSLRQQVRRVLGECEIGETKLIREKVEEFAVGAYGSAS
ncbi:MAG: type I restriction endonuclease subunit R [Pseudomonadota bacterium]|nr:type I restriction endonuclease subunit R [Pseudomonadota bacterium]